MPNAPKTPMHTVRVDDDLWESFGIAAARAGADRSHLLRQFIRWFTRDASAKLPKRP